MPGYGYDDWNPTSASMGGPGTIVDNWGGSGGGGGSQSGYMGDYGQAASPDLIHRILNWIQGKHGSGTASDPSSQYAQDAWNNAVARSPTPYGSSQSPFTRDQYGPPAPQPATQGRPVTKIASADSLRQKISDMIGPPQDFPPVDPNQFGTPQPPQVAGPGPVPDFNMGPLPARNAPVNLSDPESLGVVAAGPGLGNIPGVPTAPAVAQRPHPQHAGTGGHRIDWSKLIPNFDLRGGSPNMRGSDTAPAPGSLGSPFSVPQIVKDYMPQLRARGGGVQGWMRGGYPDVYGSGPPIRHTFNSGGENYVGAHYGDSDGRADDVNAKLSPKEYVMDAESMAMLGDGNPDAGAKKMDQMRANLRAHKGAALAKGKFSPKAKSPQEYLAGNPMGDGLRRRGRDNG